MKAFELTGAIENLFQCSMGEPRAWTRDPPAMPSINGIEEVVVPDIYKNWYAVFGYSSDSASEEQLVDALWRDVQEMHKLCVNERPTLLWRRKPEYQEATYNRKRIRTISIRIVIPEIAHGTLRDQWLKAPSIKPECEPFPRPIGKHS